MEHNGSTAHDVKCRTGPLRSSKASHRQILCMRTQCASTKLQKTQSQKHSLSTLKVDIIIILLFFFSFRLFFFFSWEVRLQSKATSSKFRTKSPGGKRKVQGKSKIAVLCWQYLYQIQQTSLWFSEWMNLALTNEAVIKRTAFKILLNAPRLCQKYSKGLKVVCFWSTLLH